MEKKCSTIQQLKWFCAAIGVCIYFFVWLFSVAAVSIHGWDTVVDDAWVLSYDDEWVLEQTIAEIYRETTAEIAIVLMSDLWGRDIFDVAMNLARNEDSEISRKDTDADQSSRWVWNEKYNNWVVIVVVPSERKRYILVWRGLEWALPDARIKRLGEEILVPAFRNENYWEWLFWLLQALSWLIKWEAEYWDESWSGWIIQISDLLIAYIFIILFFWPTVKRFLKNEKDKYIWSWVWSWVMSLIWVIIVWWVALWLLIPLGLMWIFVLFAKWSNRWPGLYTWWFRWGSFWWWWFSWFWGWSFSWWWAWWSW